MTTTATAHPASNAAVQARFEELRDQALAAANKGQLTESLTLFDAALEVARDAGDAYLIDLGICNRSSIVISLGSFEETLPELRQILLRAGNDPRGFLSAYYISRVYELLKDFRKGLFYARVAKDRATAIGRTDWYAWALNQLGNCWVADSEFEAAYESYGEALSLEEPDSVARVSMLSNLGYCQMKRSQTREGIRLAMRALRLCLRQANPGLEFFPRLDLCFGYLEMGRTRRALTHGSRALALAEGNGDPDQIKSALYLLGDAKRAAGDEEGALGCFTDLQTRFYPDSSWLPEVLAGSHFRHAVNLRA